MTDPTSQPTAACERCGRDVNSTQHLAMCGHPLQPITADEIAGIRGTYDNGGVAALGYSQVARLLNEIDRLGDLVAAYVERESADAAAGSYARRAEEAEAARDAVQAEATLLRRALIGRRTFPVGVMRTPMDERTEAIRARWDEFCFSGATELDRERDQVIGWLLDRMDSATARAEKAEAALAEVRKRLGEPVVQWAVMLDDTESSPLPEKVARRMASDPFRTTLLTRDTYPNTAWRSADAAPCTALERAADEQAEREGGGDGE